MMELNPALIAPDILSLIPSLASTVPAQSINPSAPVAQDFSALLTEMMGPVQQTPSVEVPVGLQTSAIPQPVGTEPQKMPVPVVAMGNEPQKTPAPVVAIGTEPQKMPVPVAAMGNEPQKTPAPVVAMSNEPQKTSAPVVATGNESQKPQEAQKIEVPEKVQPEPAPLAPSVLSVPSVGIGKEPQKTQDAAKTQEAEKIEGPEKVQPVTVVTSVPFVPCMITAPAAVEDKAAVPQAEAQKHVPATPMAPQPNVEKAWMDVRKFEFTVKHESTRRMDSRPQPADAAKQAMVTTDPILNTQQQELPPRVMAIVKAALDTRLAERSKRDIAPAASTEPTVAPAIRFDGVAQSEIEPVEQALAAHYVEIPDVPHVQVVRTVAMEVGDAGSQVVIRLQERGGDLSLQLDTSSESLRNDLSSSVESLVDSLKREEVQVSSVEVTRKSPIDKVRRMKEAR